MTVRTLTLDIMFIDPETQTDESECLNVNGFVQSIIDALVDIQQQGTLLGHVDSILCRSALREDDVVIQFQSSLKRPDPSYSGWKQRYT